MPTVESVASANLSFAPSPATQYLSFGHGNVYNDSTEAKAKVKLRFACTLSKLYVKVIQNNFDGATDITVRKNGANGNEVVSFSGTGTFEDTSNTDSFTSGQDANYSFVTIASTGLMDIEVMGNLITTSGNTIIKFQDGAGGGAIDNRYFDLVGALSDGGISIPLHVKNSGTFQNMLVNVNLNDNNVTLTYHSNKNGSDGNLSISVTATTTGVFEDTTHSDSVVSGDLFSKRVANSGTGAPFANWCIEHSTSKTHFYYQGDTIQHSGGNTDYCTIIGSFTSNSTESKTQFKTRLSTYDVEFLDVNVPSNTSGASTYSLRKNGADSSIVISIPSSTTGVFSDTTDSVVLTSGDLINYKLITAGGGSISTRVLNLYVPGPITTQTKTFTINAVLKKSGQTKSFTIDVDLMQTQTKGFLIDAILKKSGQTKTFTIDAMIQKQGNTKTFTIDAILINRNSKTFTIDALLKATQIKTFTIDAILHKDQFKTFTIDALLLKTQTKTFTVDSILINRRTKTFTIDADIKKTQTKTFTIDAQLRNRISKTFTINVILKATTPKNFTINALLKATQTKTFTVNAIIIITRTKTFVIDAFLKATQSKLFSLNVILKATLAKMFSVDAILVNQYKSIYTSAFYFPSQGLFQVKSVSPSELII